MIQTLGQSWNAFLPTKDDNGILRDAETSSATVLAFSFCIALLVKSEVVIYLTLISGIVSLFFALCPSATIVVVMILIASPQL